MPNTNTATDTATVNVFVYGTLKKGFGNHHYLEESKFVGYGILKGYRLYTTSFQIPVIAADATAFVEGEIYAVTVRVLSMLDRLESHPDMYFRTPVLVGEIPAYAYVWPHSTERFTKFPSTNWFRSPSQSTWPVR